MSLIDLISQKPDEAKEVIISALQNKVFDYLDQYSLDEVNNSTLNSFDARKIREEKARLLAQKKAEAEKLKNSEPVAKIGAK